MGKLIIAKDLTLAYKEPVIKSANFIINKGDFTFLTGVSGSGKTTLIKSLYGEIKPIGGILNFGGYDLSNISKSNLAKLRRRIGVVFQDYKLIPEWNILKNVALPLYIMGESSDIAEKKALEMLKLVKLSHKADRFPMELSGGEQQRAAIARAIIHEPVLLLADEPISGLDEYSASLVMDLFILANKKGITVLIASHSIPINFDIPHKHLQIEKGKINAIL